MYVLKNVTTGKYVAVPGKKNSFTQSIEHAQVFRTYEAAKANACGDEIVISVERLRVKQ